MKEKRKHINNRKITPTILQMEAAECGAASLGMVLAYHERYATLDELRSECGVSRDGSKASNIIRAAKKYGLDAKGFKMNPEDLRDVEFPIIIHWNFNHFLVLEGFKKGKAYLNDPAFGPRVVSEKEFDESFTGIVVSLEKTEEFKKGGEKPNIAKGIRKRVRGDELSLLLVIIIGLLLIFPGILLPMFSKIFVDDILLGGYHDWLTPLLIGMILTAFLRGLLTYMQKYYLLKLETKLGLGTSSKFFLHVFKLPMEFFMQRFSGEIGTRIQLNDKMAQLVSGQLATTLVNFFVAIFYLVFMMFYSVPLTLIGFGVAALNVLFLKYVSKKRTILNQRLLQEKGKLHGISTSGLQTIESLKASGAESEFFVKWAGYHAKLMNVEHQMEFTAQMLSAVPMFLMTLNNTIILSAGGFLVLNGKMSLGMLVAFQSLMSSFLAPVNTMVSMGGKFQEAKGYIDRLDDVLRNETDESIVFTEEKEVENRVKLEGYVELENVTFGYSKLEDPLIKDFSIRLRPGTRVALVGGSGSGKSTVAKIISGLYEPWEGKIYFDGKERREIQREIISNSVSMVDQDISIFEGTIRENISLWDSTILDEDIERAAKDARIHDDITELRNGYESVVIEDGANMSGGQKQRLEIARALVTNPSIMILDEATSALDPKTEKEVDDNIRKRGCTIIVVAHRLSTIRDADEIIVLDEGKIVQRGTHDEMKDVEGAYQDLIRKY